MCKGVEIHSWCSSWALNIIDYVHVCVCSTVTWIRTECCALWFIFAQAESARINGFLSCLTIDMCWHKEFSKWSISESHGSVWHWQLSLFLSLTTPPSLSPSFSVQQRKTEEEEVTNVECSSINTWTLHISLSADFSQTLRTQY